MATLSYQWSCAAGENTYALRSVLKPQDIVNLLHHPLECLNQPIRETYKHTELASPKNLQPVSYHQTNMTKDLPVYKGLGQRAVVCVLHVVGL